MSGHITIYWWLDRDELAKFPTADAYVAGCYRDRIGRYCLEHGYTPTAPVRWRRIPNAPGVWQVALRVDCVDGTFEPEALAVLVSAETLPALVDLRMP